MADEHEHDRLHLEKALLDERVEPTYLPVSLLREITRDFSEEERIRKGGFASVYKGTLRNGMVAVKKLSSVLETDKADKSVKRTPLAPSPFSEKKVKDEEYERQLIDFKNEVSCMRMAKHKNIVRFLGSNCLEEVPEMVDIKWQDEMLLCSEYIPNGTLHEYIQDESCRFQWSTRYKIIKGICEGINYLHTRDNPIIHKDLKPRNILLDHNMAPKIADFGTSKRFSKDQKEAFTQRLVLSKGYSAREYTFNHQITAKMDMYSLGIIIMDLLVGHTECMRFVTNHAPGRQIVDTVIKTWKAVVPAKGWRLKRQIQVCAELAVQCMDEDKNMVERPKAPSSPEEKYWEKRPTASYIIQELGQTESSTWSSLGQTISVSTGAELLDIHPRVLCFPFNAEEETSSLLHLTNMTKHNVAFWIIPQLRQLYRLESSHCGVVEPRETHVLKVIIKGPQKPPVDTGVFNILTVARSKQNGDDFKSITMETTTFNDDLLKRIKKLGKVHEAVLTAVIRPSKKPKIMGSTKQLESYVHSMDVHPTEPWILMSYGLKVSIWNYQTQEIVREFKVGKEAKKLPSRDPVLVQEVKFMPGDGAQWIVMGYSSGLIRVITCDEETLMKKYVHAGGIFALAVHPSQSLLLSAGGRGGIINLWKWEENWTRETYKYGVVTQIKFNTDTFTTCEYKGRIETWSIDGFMPIATLTEESSSRQESLGLGLFGPFDYLPTQSESDRKYPYMITTTDNGACIWDLPQIKNMRDEVEVNKVQVHNISWKCNEDIVAVAHHPTLPLIFIVVAAQKSIYSICFWNYINYNRLGKINRIEKTFHRLSKLGFVGSKGIVVIYKHMGEVCIEVVEIEMKTLAYQRETDKTPTVGSATCTVPPVQTLALAAPPVTKTKSTAEAAATPGDNSEASKQSLAASPVSYLGLHVRKVIEEANARTEQEDALDAEKGVDPFLETSLQGQLSNKEEENTRLREELKIAQATIIQLRDELVRERGWCAKSPFFNFWCS